MRRFIGAPDPGDPSILLISGSEARHAARVLRLTPGAGAVVISGGGEYECLILDISPSQVRARIVAALEPRAGRIRITLAQGMAKGRKMDDVVRIASELGAGSIIPLFCERALPDGPAGESANRLSRWRAIADSAAKVSGGPPCEIQPPMDIAALASIPPRDLKLVFWEMEKTSLKTILAGLPRPASALIVIGPEGGFSEKEIGLMRGAGFTAASLGERILRTQTAGAAAICAIQYHFGG